MPTAVILSSFKSSDSLSLHLFLCGAKGRVDILQYESCWFHFSVFLSHARVSLDKACQDKFPTNLCISLSICMCVCECDDWVDLAGV